MWPVLCVHMEAFARQMGYFPPCEGPTGQRGIHRDLVSNGTLDIRLSLALKFNRQVNLKGSIERHTRKGQTNNMWKKSRVLRLETNVNHPMCQMDRSFYLNSHRECRDVRRLHDADLNPLQPPWLHSMCWKSKLPECGLHTNDGHFVSG